VIAREAARAILGLVDIRIGARFRGLRHRRGWRQADLAARAGVSQDVVSLIERGRLDLVSLEKIRRVALELDAEFVIQLRWRGGDLDRLLDEGHASLVGRTAALLRNLGWEVRAEVSYSIYGERGSIDVLGWHEATRTLLVIEVKTDVVSVEETLRKHDEKVRLAGRIVAERFGWRPRTVGRLLVLPGLATPRRRVERHASVLQVAYPARGAAIRAWLRGPEGALSGILFLQPAGGRQFEGVRRRRIRRRAA
jgi:transcriptional regulator with XRE-family HTH domain